MKEKKDFILRGAFLLAVGSFFSKLLGAFYRVPLTNLLGGEGLGLYQMVFPLYTVLLDFSGAGAPSAISKIISGYRGEDKSYSLKVLKSSLILFAVLGLLGSILMAVSSFFIATLQGNKNAYICYLFLSPAVLFVSLISCFRGFFQGKKKMLPTSLSQITEQTVKLVLGLTFIKLFLPNISLASGGAVLAVSLSEFFALILLFILYLKSEKGKIKPLLKLHCDKQNIKEILKIAIPVTLVGIAIPFSQVIDSFLIVNILKKYNENATALYGLFSGTANTVINLPVSICYALAVVAIPAVSGAKTKAEKDKNSVKTMYLTFLSSIAFCLFLYFFSDRIIGILFRSLKNPERETVVNLVKTMSVNVIFLSLLQTENAVMIGDGKTYFPLIGLSFGIIVRTVLNLILLNNVNLGIYGGAISSIACYFTACLVNLIVIITLKVKYENKEYKNREYRTC